MRKCKIDLALDKLNKSRGLSYPAIGFTYYADVTGDGRRYRTVYVIRNAQGGVGVSELNCGGNAKRTLAAIKQATGA